MRIWRREWSCSGSRVATDKVYFLEGFLYFYTAFVNSVGVVGGYSVNTVSEAQDIKWESIGERADQ